ncbi:MAG: cation:proton antiporter, partial [Pseudonocardiaceae bacterium]
MNGVEFALGAGAAVLLFAVLAVRVSTRLGLPSLLLYLAIGLLIGEAGLGIQFANAPLTAALGIAGLVLILAEGGLTTRWSDIRPALNQGIALATASVAVSIGVAGWALHLLLGLDWRTALLWGAVLSST